MFPTARRRALASVLLACLFAAPAFGQNGRRFVPNRILVQFSSVAGDRQARALIAAAGAADLGQIPHTGVHILQLPDQADEESLADAFRQRAEVAFAELDRAESPAQSVTPNDPYYGSAWHLSKVAAPAAWAVTTGRTDIVVAILDTGCDPNHPDLKPKYVAGWNTYDNNADTHDVYGHGTAVAGAAAACTNNAAGVSAPAWNCKIMPMRISDAAGYGYSSTIASALTWAADHGARVANISYAMTWSQTVSAAAQYFQSKGGVVAMAAGNGGAFDSTPENPYILTVSATDSADKLAAFSTYGNHVDLSAPGVGIYTTTSGGGYGSWSGTSFAAPIVAGVAALVLSVNPGLSAVEVQEILKQSADDLGPAGWDMQFGTGRVNAGKAVSMAGGASPPDTTPPAVSITAPAAGSAVSGAVAIQAAANDNVGVASVAVYIDGTFLGADPAAPYSFSWNTAGVPNGTHTLRAVAADAAGNTGAAEISVTVSNTVDTSPPSIQIVSPADGTAVGNSTTVTVSASDNVAVARVELYVDGKLTASTTTAPFTMKWNSRKAAKGSHLLACIAYDAAGNSAVSNGVSVTK